MKALLFLALAPLGYTSLRPPTEVANCIADGWRGSAHSGVSPPVSVTSTPDYLFVGVELHPTFNSPLVTGWRHPLYAVWAEVAAALDGSNTRYHRAYQFMHRNIDGVVVRCQTAEQ